jgi:hypothetical protein
MEDEKASGLLDMLTEGSRVTNCLTGLARASSGELQVDLPPKRINPFEQSHSLLIFAFHC